jgi:hypothetical protein
MRKPSAKRLVLGLASAALLSLSLIPVASAKVPVHVRAVTWQGRILVDRTVRTGTTSVPTSSRATCLGGSPENGRKTIPGVTALGALKDAVSTGRFRQPLLISNAFDFGLGICGVGRSVARGEQWWELSVNHRPSMLGGEGTKLKRGDDVLWFLSKTYNESSPDELGLRVPRTVRRNRPFAVRVLAFDDRGRGRPVQGATISAPGTRPTNSRGYARLTLGSSRAIVARAVGLIPSTRTFVRIRR